MVTCHYDKTKKEKKKKATLKVFEKKSIGERDFARGGSSEDQHRGG